MVRRHRRPSFRLLPRIASAAALAALILVGAAAPTSAANFPASDSLYHNYAEMVTDIKAVEAAHPDIVDVHSIGKSYQGRDIWIAKISDNVKTDEPEPEILFDALHHAREHLTLEQALYTLHLLADNYGTDATVTKLVDSREVWIIFDVNPDGAEYDLTCTNSAKPPYCAWRKNRQPNSGSSYIGTDLNRNYGYHWGCCGGSSSKKSSITYRGSKAWSAPETRVVRNFVNSRVIGGIQQIRTHVTLHTNGQLILWPYGYTKTNVPYDMSAVDHNAFVAMGKRTASLNGYAAEQSSDLYITDGDEIDWMYGVHRIFSFTWELYPPETPTVWGDHYPPDERIATQTARNRSAILYTIDYGGCPYRGISLSRTLCGPFYDDLEISRGWQVNPDGTDTATSAHGAWSRGNPASTAVTGHPMQLTTTVSGTRDLATGLAAGAGPSIYDLDGTTMIRSTAIQLPATTGPLSFMYYFAHSTTSSSADYFKVFVQAEDGTRTEVYHENGSKLMDPAKWARVTLPLTDWAGQKIKIVFKAADVGTASTVEAAVDDVRIENP
jgi:carboxypeptidase T